MRSKSIILFVIVLLVACWGQAQNLQISGGNNFSAAVCDNQQVFVWGANASGQLGIDNTDTPVSASYRNTPGSVLRGNVSNVSGTTTYGNLPAISQVDAGSGAHVLGLSCAKQVWAWGDNTHGQLGRNSTTNSPVPQRVLRGEQAATIDATNDPNGIFLNNIFYVSGGNNSSFALEKGTGKVLAWGQNTNGELGNGTTVDQLTPVYVLTAAGTPLTNIVQIEGGDDCTYALDANGNVWSWGDNSGNKLGRPGAGNQVYAGKVVQGDPLNNGYSSTPTPTVYLSGIVQISGGDTHCLALDANGNVWSFGGDWGSGQLGRGGGAVYQDDARKVAIPGLTTYATSSSQFLGNGVDGKAVYVAAGQANSAVVMANGKVVTFGARGLYNSGLTDQASGTSITCPGTGDMIASGTLGDGNTTGCNSGTCNGKASQYSYTPVYVIDNSTGSALTGIVSVSDGDAWYYAVTKTGAAYVWGWNRRGELGLGDYTDRCSAVSFTLPTGCAFSAPCPGKPNLGADVTTCPVFSTTLNSNVPQTYSSYKYTWEYRSGTSGAWTTLNTALNDSATYSYANQIGQYRVTVTDNRGTVPFLCAACPVYMDTITYTEIANPYTVSACQDASASKAQFTVSGPGTPKIKWYKNSTGGSALNPSDSSATITVPYSSTNTTTPGCSRALFAEDVTSFSGVLRSGTTIASAPCAGAGTNETGSRSPLMIEVSQNLTLTGLNFIQPNHSYNYSASYQIKVYTNDPTLGYNCGSCSPANSKLGAPGTLLYSGPASTFSTVANSGAVLRTLTANYALTGTSASPVKYWIYVDGGEVQYFNSCSPAVTSSGVPIPVWTTPDVSSPAGMKGLIATHDGTPTGDSHLFNVTFNVGTSYTCGRVLVCVSNTCVLPVKYLDFTVEKSGQNALLTWSTESEKNSAYFIVQKSLDGIHYENIGKVNSAGNSQTVLDYSFVDNKLGAGTSYYRLAQYDIDGKVEYSDVRSISREGIKDIIVIPNPNNGFFSVRIVGISEDKMVKMILRNALNQVVYESSLQPAEANNINLQNISSGVYFLEAQTDEGNFITKMIKE